jgi:GNAT superfamily N-acetyltransferase
LSDELLSFEDGFFCAYCSQSFPLDAFTRDQKEVTFVVCAECGHETALTDSNDGIVGYTCSCDNYVAIPFEDGIVHPLAIMELEWNEGIRTRGVPLAEPCFAIKCETASDWRVISIMQVLAKEKNGEFRYANSDENEALLAFDPTTGVYVGYLLWNEKEEYAVLNQLFVMPEQRRKGHAEALVKHWVAVHAKRIGEQFALESPNEYARALHLKLGHIRREGDGFMGVGGCVFYPSF